MVLRAFHTLFCLSRHTQVFLKLLMVQDGGAQEVPKFK